MALVSRTNFHLTRSADGYQATRRQRLEMVLAAPQGLLGFLPIGYVKQ
jgi:hypothetical protein